MRIHRIIKACCSIAAEDIGGQKADGIARAAQKRYEELCRENASDSKALRIHTYKRIYPGIAVYEAMRAAGIPQEKAVWYIREVFQRIAGKLEPHVRRSLRIPGLAKHLPGLFMKLSQKLFGTDAGFAYEFPERRGGEMRANMVRCPYFETCRRYGCPEITTAYCDSDDALYGNMHPKLVWGRTKTIGRGADCCDFSLEYRQ